MTWPFGQLKMFGYGVIVADPPWSFKTWSKKGERKSASRHYKTMPLEKIKGLPVGHLAAPDCILFLWTTGWAMATKQAHAAVEAWGFEPKTEIVWNKLTKNGKDNWGTGYWVRSMHEPILLATLGHPPKFTDFPSSFKAVARDHSRKPSEFYSLVRRRTPHQRRADLFARERHYGFAGWGDEYQEAA